MNSKPLDVSSLTLSLLLFLILHLLAEPIVVGFLFDHYDVSSGHRLRPNHPSSLSLGTTTAPWVCPIYSTGKKPRTVNRMSSSNNKNTQQDDASNLVNPLSSSSSPPPEVGQMLGGLVFLKTTCRQELVDFYTQIIGMTIWLEQPNISILAHGNMILGFHQPDSDTDVTPDVSGMYTFVYPSLEQVNVMHQKLLSSSQATQPDGPPRINPRYQIYQFFATDPEGRALEFQAFLHPLPIVSSQVPPGASTD